MQDDNICRNKPDDKQSKELGDANLLIKESQIQSKNLEYIGK